MDTLKFSFIIPVFNRPDEIQELLESFMKMKGSDQCEIVIVEDGSTKPCEPILEPFHKTLNISYYTKPNTGPGDSRNFGMTKAKGTYFIILDSDVLLPTSYLTTVSEFLKSSYYDCFGGPDTAHESFTDLQKAINFAMTSFMTTGGIRGGKKQLEHFQPRSFNMGISKKAFEASNGFGKIHPGEDPDLSLRLNKLGFKTTLISGAYVYHKRRISWSKFFTQVYKFGLVRPIITAWHPNSKSIIYWLPGLFTFGLLLALILILFSVVWPLMFYLVYFMTAFLVALYNSKSTMVSLFAVLAIVIQFVGYSYGFLKSNLVLHVFQKAPKAAFPNLFFD
jgi:GT2 family glycosyltransferase